MNSNMQQTAKATILLIICGGIAAYKSLLLIRLLRAQHIKIIPVMTKAAKEFVTPLSVATLAETKVYDDLFSLTDEIEIGHIELTRMADMVVIVPATANIIAKMAHGIGDDLASTLLLANLNPVMICPAMNHAMWNHPATKANIALLEQRAVTVFGPDQGPMACNETGPGRMREPEAIADYILQQLVPKHAKPLAGKKIVITAGPTHEPIDDIRYIANHSSGKQGYAIAKALVDAGALVTLVTGPTQLAPPSFL